MKNEIKSKYEVGDMVHYYGRTCKVVKVKFLSDRCIYSYTYLLEDTQEERQWVAENLIKVGGFDEILCGDSAGELAE